MSLEESEVLRKAKQEIGDIIHYLNSTTLCFTGHRSQKLPWRFNENDPRCIAMKNTLKAEIEKSIKEGFNTFLTGMAIGFDIICAEILLELKKIYKEIKIIAAFPCKTQSSLWPENDKKRYRNVLSQLDGVRCIYNDYIGAECMIERNRYMVNKSSKLTFVLAFIAFSLA